MRYGYVRAKTRALTAGAVAALVAVPLTGAAAAALVSTPDAMSLSGDVVAAAPLGSDSLEVAPEVVASKTSEFTVDTPAIKVKANGGATPVSSVRQAQPSASVKAAIAGSAIVAEAAKYVGTPYLLGGSTPAGFDCSGFVSYVYAKFGISLPRSSGAYYNVGVRVSTPQPGDIIVSPGHVSIYAGPNLQIDSPVPGKTIQFRSIWQSNPIYVRVTH